jgi:hypothetical protein
MVSKNEQANSQHVSRVTCSSTKAFLASQVQKAASIRSVPKDDPNMAFVKTRDGETVLAVDVDESFDPSTGFAPKRVEAALKLKFCSNCSKHVNKASWCSR